MHIRSASIIFTLAGSLFMTSGIVRAEQNSPIYLAADSPMENTERNVRDRNDATVTPEDQKETEQDVKLTAEVRKALVKDESLSVNAQNVKIISHDGVVTLRGPVENAAESAKLQKIATGVRGVQRVENQLEVKAP